MNIFANSNRKWRGSVFEISKDDIFVQLCLKSRNMLVINLLFQHGSLISFVFFFFLNSCWQNWDKRVTERVCVCSMFKEEERTYIIVYLNFHYHIRSLLMHGLYSVFEFCEAQLVVKERRDLLDEEGEVLKTFCFFNVLWIIHFFSACIRFQCCTNCINYLWLERSINKIGKELDIVFVNDDKYKTTTIIHVKITFFFISYTLRSIIREKNSIIFILFLLTKFKLKIICIKFFLAETNWTLKYLGSNQTLLCRYYDLF